MAKKLIGAAIWFREMLENVAGMTGKAAVGSATLVFLFLAIYVTGKKAELTDNVLYGFVAIWTGFTVNRTVGDWRNKKDGETK